MPQNADSPPIKADHSIPSLLQNSLNAVDIDSRPNLLSNIIVTGGSSLLNGFTERLGNEIQTLFPGPRTKVTASNNMVERKFGSWIGGSILSSLGNFQQVSTPLVLTLHREANRIRCGFLRGSTRSMDSP